MRKACFEREPQRYKYETDGSIENKEYNILWDFTIQCDTKTEARRPHIVANDKTKKEVKIVYATILGDVRVNEREL